MRFVQLLADFVAEVPELGGRYPWCALKGDFSCLGQSERGSLHFFGFSGIRRPSTGLGFISFYGRSGYRRELSWPASPAAPPACSELVDDETARVHHDRARHRLGLPPQHRRRHLGYPRCRRQRRQLDQGDRRVADDFEDADGTNVLSFWQAVDKARKTVRGTGDAAGRPSTIAEAIAAYKTDLAAQGRAIANATRVNKHLPPSLAAPRSLL